MWILRKLVDETDDPVERAVPAEVAGTDTP